MLIWPFCLNLHYSDMNLSLNGGNGAAAKGNISTLAIIQRGRKEVLQFTQCAPVVWCLRRRLKPFKMPVHHFLDGNLSSSGERFESALQTDGLCRLKMMWKRLCENFLDLGNTVFHHIRHHFSGREEASGD